MNAAPAPNYRIELSTVLAMREVSEKDTRRRPHYLNDESERRPPIEWRSSTESCADKVTLLRKTKQKTAISFKVFNDSCGP